MNTRTLRESNGVGKRNHGYDAVGNRLFTRNNVQPDRSERYGYDNRDRLTVMERGVLGATGGTITTPLTHPRLASDQQWSDLDRRGNWLEYRHATGGTSVKQTRVVNGVNEYLSITDDFLSITRPYTQTHDAAGNMTVNPKAITVGDNCLTVGGDPPCGEGQKYTYDEENRVTSIRRLSDDELLAEYEYDALGRRAHTIEHIDVETGVALATPKKTRHIYAGIETIEEYEVTADEYGNETPPAVLLREFLWGNAANFPEPIAMIDHTDAGEVAGNPTGPGEVFHYLHDILGSVVALTNAAGTLVERYTYDPYGQTLIEGWDATANGGTGAWLETNASTYANPFAWTGQRYDAAVHLYAFFARTYSPALGRWLHRDPLGYVDGANLYQYVSGNPLKFVDPFGLEGDDKGKKGDKSDKGKKKKKVKRSAKDSKIKSTLLAKLKDICDDECKKRGGDCDKIKACKTACYKEASKIVNELWEEIKRLQEAGINPNCAAWAMKLRVLLRALKLKYFEFDAINLGKAAKKPTSGHAMFGLKGKSKTDKGTIEKGPDKGEYDVWDILIDQSNWQRWQKASQLGEYVLDGDPDYIIEGPPKEEGIPYHPGPWYPYGPGLAG